MISASGSVVEYRLAKARVAGSNPVSRSFILSGDPAAGIRSFKNKVDRTGILV